MRTMPKPPGRKPREPGRSPDSQSHASVKQGVK